MSTIPRIFIPQLILPEFPVRQRVLLSNMGSCFFLISQEVYNLPIVRILEGIRMFITLLHPIPEVDINVRTDIVKRLFGPEAQPPTPFRGAAKRYFGIARKDYPDLTPSKAQKLLRELRRGRSF